jgi:hypothetical protein
VTTETDDYFARKIQEMPAMPTSFERLEALNVEIVAQARGLLTNESVIRDRYFAILLDRADEVQSAITAARADTQRYVFGRVSPHHYIDGIAACLTRARLASAKGRLPA